MRIGIDARSILNPEKGEAIGVGHYTYQLIRYLLQIDKENDYVLFFDWRVREKDVKKFSQSNVKIKFYPFSDYKKYMPVAYNEILGTATLAKENLDILHSTSQFNRVPTSYRGNLIVTVHDLAAFHLQEAMPKIKKAKAKTVTKLMVEKSQQIIAPSQFLKEDIMKLFNINSEKVNVIKSGLDERFWEQPKIGREKFLEKFSIPGKYILFLGTLEPSKNITRLLQAFKTFLEKSEKPYTLILAGKRGWLSKEYKQIVKDLGIEKQVKFLGYIIGDDLVPLFKYSDFFVLPSLYEGFGMTILESYAVGTPVIASKLDSISEIAKEASYLVNPIDVGEVAEAMLNLSQNLKQKENLSQKGKEKAREFDWKKCAGETLEVYKKFEQKNV